MVALYRNCVWCSLRKRTFSGNQRIYTETRLPQLSHKGAFGNAKPHPGGFYSENAYTLRKEALIFLLQLCEALENISELSLVHGDVSPQNILLTDVLP